MAALLDINPTATDRIAVEFAAAYAAGAPAVRLVGENAIMRHRGATAAGETSALVVRCVL
jgi:hypothetical protein